MGCGPSVHVNTMETNPSNRGDSGVAGASASDVAAVSCRNASAEERSDAGSTMSSDVSPKGRFGHAAFLGLKRDRRVYFLGGVEDNAAACCTKGRNDDAATQDDVTISGTLFAFHTEDRSWQKIDTGGLSILSKRAFHSVFVHGQRVVVHGGWGDGAALSDTAGLSDASLLKVGHDIMANAHERDEIGLYTWKEDTWESFRSSGENPGSSPCSHTSTQVGPDIFIIGGWTTGRGLSCDVHTLNMRTGVWRQVATKGETPEERAGHSAVFIGGFRILIFGGRARGRLLNDVHILSIGSFTWKRIPCKGLYPEARAAHSAVYDDKRERVVFMGGWGECGPLRDVCVLDLRTMTWQLVGVEGSILPQPRCGHTCTDIGGKLVVYGGYSVNEFGEPVYLNDVYSLELKNDVRDVSEISVEFENQVGWRRLHGSDLERRLILREMPETLPSPPLFELLDSILRPCTHHEPRTVVEEEDAYESLSLPSSPPVWPDFDVKVRYKRYRNNRTWAENICAVWRQYGLDAALEFNNVSDYEKEYGYVGSEEDSEDDEYMSDDEDWQDDEERDYGYVVCDSDEEFGGSGERM